jgi:murein DD-endopeptidase MepM/ murein hydrolase activator NlpD
LEYRKLRGSNRYRAEPDPVDLGNEPPLSVDGAATELIDRRRVSLRWYCGTILNGLCGAALMGGAVYVALDGEAFFAATPERAEPLRGSLSRERTAGAARKADRLPTLAETHTARQLLRVSTTVQVGEREVVRVRPFVRVATGLSLSTSELSADIGPFNASRVMAAASSRSGAATIDEPPTVDEADFSFVMRELEPLLGQASTTVAAPMEQVMARVREAANWGAGASSGAALARGIAGTQLAYAAQGNLDPYAGLETRIVPENITLLPKTAPEITGGSTWNERSVVAREGDTLVGILRDLGATAAEADAIVKAAGARAGEALRDGQRLRVLLAPAGASRLQPIRVIQVGENGPEFVVALSDTGRYVSVDVESAELPQVAENEEDDERGGTVRLYQSLYETALRQQVPRPLIDELVRIYSYDVDFQRKVQPGDSFELLYPGEEDGEARAEVLFASLTVGGETRRYYRFHTPDDGVVDYYDEHGKSAKQFLVRKPMEAGIMRSGYGWRRHPILGYSKMHTGVDWAAPRGTPILAAGNGVVERAGWEGGYGKYIRIRHAFGYETAYAHMSAFARGISAGVRVRQGQVIGYVGSTGLSTGPHLHYEVLVNGRFVDPVRIRLPRGRSLEGSLLAQFERERDRVDALMNRGSVSLTDVRPPRGPRREASARR